MPIRIGLDISPDLVGVVVCEACDVEVGDRMLIWCDEGPSMCRAVLYPPPLEIDIDEGLYVLVDDGATDRWRYEFVAG